MLHGAHCGGGIKAALDRAIEIGADSVPRLEWKETMNKARAIFRVVALAASGIDGARET